MRPLFVGKGSASEYRILSQNIILSDVPSHRREEKQSKTFLMYRHSKIMQLELGHSLFLFARPTFCWFWETPWHLTIIITQSKISTPFTMNKINTLSMPKYLQSLNNCANLKYCKQYCQLLSYSSRIRIRMCMLW